MSPLETTLPHRDGAHTLVQHSSSPPPQSSPPQSSPPPPPQSSPSSSSSSGRRQKKTSRSSSSVSPSQQQQQQHSGNSNKDVLSDPQYRAMLLLRELEEEASTLKLMHCKIADQVHRLQIEESVLQRQLHNMEHTGHGNLSEVGQWLNSLVATSTGARRDAMDTETHGDVHDGDGDDGRRGMGWNMGDAQLPHTAISDHYDQYQSSSLYGTYTALPQSSSSSMAMIKLEDDDIEDDDDDDDDAIDNSYVRSLMAPFRTIDGSGIGHQQRQQQQQYAEGVGVSGAGGDSSGRYGASSSLGSMVGTQSLMQQLMSMQQHGEQQQQHHHQRVQHPWLIQQQQQQRQESQEGEEMGDGLSMDIYREPLSFSRLLGIPASSNDDGSSGTIAAAAETSGAAEMTKRFEGENMTEMVDGDNVDGSGNAGVDEDMDDDESERDMRDILARHRASLGQHDTQEQSEHGPD